MKMNKTHKKSEINLGKSRGYTYKITCTIAVNKHRMLKEGSNECYGNNYDPKVSYKMIFFFFDFMNFNKNFINRIEKVEKTNG